MNWLIKQIPNSITSLNLFSGCVAGVAAFNGQFSTAAIAIGAAAVFDFFDGFSARLLKAYSPMGKELDSLADVVSFGVAPSVIMFSFLKQIAATCGITCPVLPYVAFIIAVFSALRLAKFNIDERQTTSFIGLPTPANAIFWMGFPFLIPQLLANSTAILAVTVVLILLFSYLLVAEIPMFSLKIKSLAWSGNQRRYILIVGALAAIIGMGWAGLSIAILLYILLAVTERKA